MMNKLPSFLLFFLPLFISIASVSSQFHEFDWFCEDIAYYTADSTYHTNLIPLFSYLTNQASHSNFGNYSIGLDLDQVNMYYMCRGNLNGTQCQSCVEKTTQRAIVKCPNDTGVIFWYQECMIRYSNMPIFSFEDESYSSWLCSIANVSDPIPYDEVLVNTTNGLILEAAYNQSMAGYGIGEGNVSGLVLGSNTVYVYVQCTADILGSRCERCLKAALRSIAGRCGVRRLAAQFYHPSCQIQYDVVDFISGAVPSPMEILPPPSSVLPPAPSPSSATAMIKSGGNKFVIGFIAVAVIILFSMPSN